MDVAEIIPDTTGGPPTLVPQWSHEVGKGPKRNEAKSTFFCIKLMTHYNSQCHVTIHYHGSFVYTYIHYA